MGDAINPLTGRHLSGRPAGRGAEQTAWDQANPNYFTTGAGSFASYGRPSQQTQQMADSYKQRIDSGQTLLNRGPESLAYGQVYGGKPAGKPGQAQSQQSPYANSTAYGQPVSNTPNVQGGQMHSFYSQPAGQGRPATPSGPSATNSPAPYQAYSPATQQAQAFQQQMPSFQFAGGTDWMGNQYTDPNAMMAQTGAMAQALNQQRQGMMVQGQFGSLNPQMAYNQGMEMLQQGWQNPFAQQPQDPGGNIRDLIQGPQPGKPEPTPGLPSGLYRPGNVMADLGPDWHTTYYNPSTGETFNSYKNSVRPEEGSGWVNQGRQRTQEPTSGLYDQYQQERAGQQAQQGREQAMRELYFLTGQRQTPTVQSDFSADKVQRWMNQERQSSNWEYDNQSRYYPDKVGGRGLTNRLFDFLGRAPAATGNATVDARQREGFARQAGDALQQAVAAGTIGQQEAAAISRWYATGGQEGESPADARRRVEYSQWLESRGMSPTEAAEASRGQYAVPELSPGGPATGGYLDWHIQQGQRAMTRRADQERQSALDRRAKEAAAGPKGPTATEQWNKIRMTTNTQTKPLSPAHQRVYEAFVAEQMKSSGRGVTWMPSGSPIADRARALNALRGQGITGMEPRQR
jgi:hypothetical protein